MIVVNFPDDEMRLLQKAAEELGVGNEMHFFGGHEVLRAQALVTAARREMPNLPRLMILNLDTEGETWRTLLAEIKEHPVWRFVPVMGFMSDSSSRNVGDFYALRGASCVKKPGCYKELRSAVNAALTYWLEVSHVPSAFIAPDDTMVSISA